MTGRNPWVVLGVAEDTPYHEVQRAFRRRVKRTHPDGGGDAGEFATVVQAFEVVRQALPPECRRRPARPTPYDSWLRPGSPTRSWTEDERRGSAVFRPSADSGASPTVGPGVSDFTALLQSEMSKARAGVAGA
jgi:hypothetical protein